MTDFGRQSADAASVLARGEGRSFWFLNTLVTLKVTGEETQGAYGLIEQVAPPGFAPPLHMHHNEDEQFYILEGELTFFPGEQELHAGPGSFVYLPRGVPHSFRVDSSEPARLLEVNTPAGFEGIFSEMGEPTSELVLPAPSPPDMQKLIQMAQKYNFEILGPPPVH